MLYLFSMGARISPTFYVYFRGDGEGDCGKINIIIKKSGWITVNKVFYKILWIVNIFQQTNYVWRLTVKYFLLISFSEKYFTGKNMRKQFLKNIFWKKNEKSKIYSYVKYFTPNNHILKD